VAVGEGLLGEMITIPLDPAWILLIFAVLGVAILYVKDKKLKKILVVVKQAVADGKITAAEGWQIIEAVIEYGKDVYEEIQKKQKKGGE